MKKLKSLGVVAAATILLTSCLDGNNEYTNPGVGVVEMSLDAMGNNVVYIDDNYPIYSPVLKDLKENDCIVFTYTVNQDDQANNSGNKYLTASNLVVAGKLDNSGVINRVDTSTIMKNEMAALDANLLTRSSYSYTIRDYFFVSTTHEKIASDQKNRYILEANYDQEPQTVDGKRVYDLFLRVVKEEDGKGITSTNSIYYAFDAGYLFKSLESKEKTAGNKSLNIRLNYIKSFSSDSTSATWNKTAVIECPIYTESN